MTVQIVPVILSGGSGTRLWPLSTEVAPKQFHALNSSLSLLQETALRLRGGEGLDYLPPVVICSRQHQTLVLEQLAAVGMEPSALVIEPVGRSTGPAAAVAARLVQDLHPGALALLAPADHVVGDVAAFHAAVGCGLKVARDRLVTFAIQPTGPETGYGYIQRGEALAPGAYEVQRFAEKPPRAVAETYLASGDFAWNAGIFLFAPEILLEEMALHRPDILSGAIASLEAATWEGVAARLDPTLFADTPAESIDIAVMERTARAAVVPCSVGWADIGSWNELWRMGCKDSGGNVVQGAATVLDCRDSLIWAEDVKVAALGLNDLVVVASQGAVLILPRSRAQEVKRLLGAAKASA